MICVLIHSYRCANVIISCPGVRRKAGLRLVAAGHLVRFASVKKNGIVLIGNSRYKFEGFRLLLVT